jgi:signal transduction histidine kinase
MVRLIVDVIIVVTTLAAFVGGCRSSTPRLVVADRNSNSAFLTMTRKGTAWLSVAFLIFATMGAAAEPRRVLMLHAFGHAYSPWSDMAGSFRAELIKRSPEPIDLYEVSLDTARVQDPKDEGPFVEYIRAVLSGRKLDLIVPVGAPAAFFAQRYRQLLFPATPMLIVGADLRRIPSATRADNDTAVLLDLDLPAYLQNILHLLPETKDVAVVVGNSPVERFWASELRRDFQPFADRVNITWFNELSFGEMLERAAAMPPRSVIFWFLLSEDAAGVPYSQDRALETMREVAVVPIFGMGDYQLGRGIVGGPLMQTGFLGREAAEVGLRILRGEAPDRVNPPLVAFGAPIYDWRELQRWNIGEAVLPHDSIVQFREPTVWQQYRLQIIGALAIVLFQAVLIAGLLFERQARKRAAEQAGKARMETGRYRENLAHLVRVHTVGEMSTAIAHEVNQPLVAIKNYALAARRRLTGDGTLGFAKVEELLDKIEAQASRAGDVLQSLRAMVKKHESEATETDLGELVAVALKLVEMESRNANIRVESAISPGLPPVFVDGIQIQQVVLNLTRNAIEAIEEAGITSSVIKVGVVGTAEKEIAVSVTDCGPGISPEDAKRIFDPFYSTKGGGLGVGLSISRAIVEAHGGRLSLAPNGGGGCVFQFTLPVANRGN